MQKKPTIYDIAKITGYSPATVSLVLHNNDKVKPSTRKKILKTIKELNFSPNYMARSLSMKNTHTIGLILPQIENPIFSKMIYGAEKYINEHGYNLLLGITNSSEEKELFYLDLLNQKKVDGLIIFPTYVDTVIKYISSFNSETLIPTVLCGSSGNNCTNVSYVKCDNHHGSYQAINHLIERGRKKIGFIAAVSTEQQAKSRLQGYKDALKENGFEFNERLVKYCEQDKASIYNATLELLEGTEVDALFCLYDYMALPVMRAIASKGLSIPNDISIIGYDNIPIDSFLPITLSSVNTFSEEIGRKAAKLLLKHIKDPSLPIQQIILRPEVVVREST